MVAFVDGNKDGTVETGRFEGTADGRIEGNREGRKDGFGDGCLDRTIVGDDEGFTLGRLDGDFDGLRVVTTSVRFTAFSSKS